MGGYVFSYLHMSILGQSVLLDFFQQLYSHDQGYICIATTRPPARRDTFTEQFFEWPTDTQAMLDYIDKVTPTHNVYFCVNILSVPRRRKENAIPQNLVWADLDTCSPQSVEIPPQTVIESSPNRWQAIWKLDRKIDPTIAENYSRRIAYLYADQGADKSGWDLGQLLRVPSTYNFKYQTDETPVVGLVADIEEELPTEIFEALPMADFADLDVPAIPVPDLNLLPQFEMIVYKHKEQLEQAGFASTFSRYINEEPRENWSKQLWRLHLLCIEVGMSPEETFVVAKNAKCNKYERDGRPDSHLWREILKAELERKTVETLLQDHRYLAMPSLLTAHEQEILQPTLIDDYVKWATETTDAVPEYHELCCAMVMSALMATTLRLESSLPRKLVPNLWALILGESTLTRKTTAMDAAMNFIFEIDPDMFVTSDSSMEGLMTALSLRPQMVSIFYRDEITGFFNAVQRRDYLAGMHEALTKMYDVPPLLKRTLKKDVYTVREPIFMMFGGGIADKAYSLIDEEYITSGFIPRFLVVHGKADVSKVRHISQPTTKNTDKHDTLMSTFRALHSIYSDQIAMTPPGGGQPVLMAPERDVEFTPEMWERAAKMEDQLIQAASEAPDHEKALPMFSRMYVSLLKLTMLFAAARQEPPVKANMNDLLSAAHYIEKWGSHTVQLIRNSGNTGDESKLQACYRSIEARPGILRSEIMQKHRLNSKQVQVVEDTLIQRAMIDVVRKGNKSRTYWPIGR